MSESYPRNKLVECPEPGILFTRDNAAWVYHALKAVRESGQSIPEQDELCDELAGILFPPEASQQRLEAIRASLRAGNISYGELTELQALAPHTEPGDTELLEAAGVPGYPHEQASTANSASLEAFTNALLEQVPLPGNDRADAKLARLADAISAAAGIDPDTASWLAARVFGTLEAMRVESGEYRDPRNGPPWDVAALVAVLNCEDGR